MGMVPLRAGPRRRKEATSEPVPGADEQAFRAAVADGIVDAASGRTVPYEDVRRWLVSWGTKDELPPPVTQEAVQVRNIWHGAQSRR